MTETAQQSIGEMIEERAKSPVRLTPALLKDKIASKQFHVFPGSQLTVCVLTLSNGYTVTGESACVDPANFDAEIGERVAFENAFNKIWALEGYLLKQRIFEATGK